METKICNNCKLEKKLTDFNRKNSRDGYQTFCRDCQKIYKRKHYLNNKKQYLNRNQKTRERLRELVKELKNNPCTDCGKSYPYYVMDFDHRDPSKKRFAISNANMRMNSEKKLMEEVSKCDLVCSNCHRERTHGYLLRKR